jgi:hypothetical protein
MLQEENAYRGTGSYASETELLSATVCKSGAYGETAVSVEQSYSATNHSTHLEA